MVVKITLRRFPHRAFKYGNPNGDALVAVERNVVEAVRSVIANQPVPNAVWQGLRWVPKVALQFSTLLLRRDDIMSLIEVEPVAALYTLANAGQYPLRYMALAERIEAAIMTDGELLAQYLAWAKEAKVQLPQSWSTYRDAMMRQPLFGIKWASVLGDKEFPSDMVAWAHSNAQREASAAWAVVVANSSDPYPYRPILAMNPLYAIACSAATGVKFSFNDFTTTPEPRWLYQLLANGAVEDPDEFEKALFAVDPLWGLEWLIESQQTGNLKKISSLVDGVKLWETNQHPLVRCAYDSVMAVIDSNSGNKSGDSESPPEAPSGQEEGSDGAPP